MDDLWYSEYHTEHVRFSLRVKAQLYAAQSDYQHIAVYDSPEFGRFLTLDGVMMLTERDEFIYHEMMVHVPMAANPNIRDVLVIGAGDGGVLRELAKYKTVRHVDLVEIDAQVIEVCRKCLPGTACGFDDPRVQVHVADGLKFIRHCERKYDLILVDSTDPTGPGEVLFTKEFYGNCRAVLNPDGILVNQHESPFYAADAQAMMRALCEDYGNPSSMHRKGVESEKYIRYAKETIAKLLKVQEKEIIFTSGGTESDNIALIGAAYANHRAGRHIITTRIEHPAVLQTCAYLEEQGFQVTYLPVDRNGAVNLYDLEKAMTRGTILVSLMHVNNEIGTIEPIEQAGELIKRLNPNTLFHVDAVQSFGKFAIYPKRMHIDMLSVSAHKIHGPKGVGFLYVNEKAKVRPIIFGGGQQKGMRSGTENVPGIAGMALAAEEAYSDLEGKRNYLYALKDRFTDGLAGLDGIRINGPLGRDGAPNVVSVSIQGVRSEVMLHALEDKGIYVSAGSACSSNKPSASATLKAIGVEKQYLDSTIRFSMSVLNTEEDMDYTLRALKELVPMLRRYTRY